MDKNDNIIQLVQKYLDNTFTKEEYDLVIDFMRRPDAETLIEEWEEKGLLKDPAKIGETDNKAKEKKSLDSELKLTRLLSKIFEYENPRLSEKKKKPPFFGFLKAAVILLTSGLLVWFAMKLVDQTDHTGPDMITKNTARGQKITLTLPDGTTVQMNSETKLTFPMEFGNRRQVLLDGEAFFMVKRDEQKPFVVQTGNLHTEVLGTTFNIKAFKNEIIEITVATGKVKVTSTNVQNQNSSLNNVNTPLEGKGGVLLTPNQQALFDASTNTLKARNVDTNIHIAWKEGVLKFSEVRFQDVVIDLERWYGVDIDIDPRLNECIVIGQYQNESLETILKSFEFLMEIDYEFGKDGVHIKGEGCGPVKQM